MRSTPSTWITPAARAGTRVGGVFALATEREYAVAERISRMVPAAELVRFSNSGTEAVETDALKKIAAYGERLRAGMSRILAARGIPHAFAGHPSMSGLFFAEAPPGNYRDWARSDYTFYDTMAPLLHERGVLCEPDSRAPWFVCEAHDERCLEETLRAFEAAVDETMGRTRRA